MTPDEANFVGDLRMRVLQNEKQGLPPHAGISEDLLEKALAIIRQDWTVNQGKSKASGVSNPVGGGKPPIDLKSLFTTQATSTKK